ncbi:MAG: hypothetical protein HOI09_01530, partial [Porticoccaceae bacterium]|nr:hypothetical protein [Porticoccaceae bacterium]
MLKRNTASVSNQAPCKTLKINNIKAYMEAVGVAALESSRVIARASTEVKNHALTAIAARLSDDRQMVLSANLIDMENGLTNGLDASLLDRLELNNERIEAMIEGLHQVAALPDPVG